MEMMNQHHQLGREMNLAGVSDLFLDVSRVEAGLKSVENLFSSGTSDGDSVAHGLASKLETCFSSLATVLPHVSVDEAVVVETLGAIYRSDPSPTAVIDALGSVATVAGDGGDRTRTAAVWRSFRLLARALLARLPDDRLRSFVVGFVEKLLENRRTSRVDGRKTSVSARCAGISTRC